QLAIAQGKFANATSTLRGLSEQADSLGLRYAATLCQLLTGEAFLGTKDLSAAEKQLKTAVTRSQKLGLRTIEARSHVDLAKVFELSGNPQEAASHKQEATSLADAILQDAQTQTVKNRYDLAPLFALKQS